MVVVFNCKIARIGVIPVLVIMKRLIIRRIAVLVTIVELLLLYGN